ncbi:MAG: hypothetical protein DRI57_08720 [Deltaproteobacteria bacterium]|nr:MAG: hypothetical protein DRI57_08720 [Deltaproteobacteria bacterium]
MINFILNNQEITTRLPLDTKVLDFLRLQQNITSVKPGCRTGNCGVCMILVGELYDDMICYRSANSCLLPLAEANAKHIVTVEGLSDSLSNPIQEAIADERAAQCGYCTPGMVISLTAFFLNSPSLTESLATVALDGNLCRCTGYQSIKRVLSLLCQQFELPDKNHRVPWLIGNQILPPYFSEIPQRLQKFTAPKTPLMPVSPNSTIVAGSTIPWQKDSSKPMVFLSQYKELSYIRIEKNRCHVGATTTMEVIKNSPVMRELFPKIEKYFDKIASTPIRSRATIGGNIVSASPIHDLSIFFLGLGASVDLYDGQNQRTLRLKDFFKAYNQIDKKDDELVKGVHFSLPDAHVYFNFERVCKHSDSGIPSVNSAIWIRMNGNGLIQQIHLSAGGVAPIPLYLTKTADFLSDKEINAGIICEAGKIAQTEISPISDIRGSVDYKRLLLRQLFYAHFITLFPKQIDNKELVQ